MAPIRTYGRKNVKDEMMMMMMKQAAEEEEILFNRLKLLVFVKRCSPFPLDVFFCYIRLERSICLLFPFTSILFFFFFTHVPFYL